MKKVLVLAVAMSTMLTITGCDVKFGVKEKNYHKGEVVSIDNKVVYNGENEIDIDLGCGVIEISSYDGDEVLVDGKTYKDFNTINVESSGNKIKIEDTGSSRSKIDLYKNIDDIEPNVKIKIPNKFTGDMVFKYGAGEISVNNLTCNKLKVEGGAGQLNIDLKKVGGNLTCESGMGEVNIKIPEDAPVYFDSETGLGEMNLKAKTSGENLYKYSLKVGMGEITVYN